MVKVKALKELSQGGMIRFTEGQEIEVSRSRFEGRYYLKTRDNKILIPIGFVQEIEDFKHNEKIKEEFGKIDLGCEINQEIFMECKNELGHGYSEGFVSYQKNGTDYRDLTEEESIRLMEKVLDKIKEQKE